MMTAEQVKSVRPNWSKVETVRKSLPSLLITSKKGNALVGELVEMRAYTKGKQVTSIATFRLQSTNCPAEISEKVNGKFDQVPTTVKENDLVDVLLPGALLQALKGTKVGDVLFIEYKGSEPFTKYKADGTMHTFDVSRAS